MTRYVLCPECHAKNDYPDLVISTPALAKEIAELCDDAKLFDDLMPDITLTCYRCDSPLMINMLDFQDVEFAESNDGYHSWYSQPTAIHTIWRCRSYPKFCPACVHKKQSDCFCVNGRIDIRTPL